MAYNPQSSVLAEHRAKLLAIALQHARAGGLRSLNRARIAAEGKVSLGVVSAALGPRDEMIALVQSTARAAGEELSYI